MTKNESANNNIIIKKVAEDDLSILKEYPLTLFVKHFQKIINQRTHKNISKQISQMKNYYQK